MKSQREQLYLYHAAVQGAKCTYEHRQRESWVGFAIKRRNRVEGTV